MKTIKTKKIKKSPKCTGYSIGYRDQDPHCITLSSDQGLVSVDRETMLQIINDWENASDEDFSLPNKYIFDVEAR